MIPHVSRAESIARTQQLGSVAPEPVAAMIAEPVDDVLDLRCVEPAEAWAERSSWAESSSWAEPRSVFWTEPEPEPEPAPDRVPRDGTHIDVEGRYLVRWDWWVRVVTWLRAPA
jgi:hypothetical protein